MILVLTCCAAAPASPDQGRIPNYAAAIEAFWNELYATGGETLYCGRQFGRDPGPAINVEHVTPMAWAMNLLGCDDRQQCRHDHPRFNRMEADLHNLYPAVREINRARGSHSFGMVAGEDRRFGNCDLEIDEGRRRVEPRPASRGEIARAIFYMHDTYGIPVFTGLGITLRRWHRDDPPDSAERRRNDRIEALQGTRNRFIDDSRAADALWF